MQLIIITMRGCVKPLLRREHVDRNTTDQAQMWSAARTEKRVHDRQQRMTIRVNPLDLYHLRSIFLPGFTLWTTRWLCAFLLKNGIMLTYTVGLHTFDMVL